MSKTEPLWPQSAGTLADSFLRELSRKLNQEQQSTPLSFREYVNRVRPRFRWFKHCEVLADVLQRVADGKLKRVMVFMPPRHGKSELASRLFPAYWLYRRPHQWVGINAYGALLANGLSRNAREFYQRGGAELKGDAAAVQHWETSAGGGAWAAGVGGAILGKGWHLGIIDDPVKNAVEAFSDTTQASHRDWYDSTFVTREEPDDDDNPDGAIVVINQRWADKDLCGWLLSREHDDEESPERWHVVAFEAIKEDTAYPIPPTCTLEPDWRQPGEALCPQRRPLEKLLKQKKINPFFFSALYQQRPVPHEGAMFQSQWFEIVDECPAKMERVRYWDTASAKPGKGDWTVGCLMGKTPDNRFFIENVIYGQWPADERNKVIKQTTELDQQAYGRVLTYVEQPPGLAKESTDAIVRMLAGYPAEADPVHRDKPTRAEPLAAQTRAGNVYIKAGPWNKTFLDTLCVFPFGNHDDHVDAASGAFNKLAVQRQGKFS